MCHLAKPDRIMYADTGAEDPDNRRFLLECEDKLFTVPVEIVKSDKYDSTWDVWEGRRFLGSIFGAPCTKYLKRIPLDSAAAKVPGAVVLIGFTVEERSRAAAVVARNEGKFEFPLIDRGVTKDDCRGLLERKGVREPIAYSRGFSHSNCIPCCKASSGDYWQLMRRWYPEEYERFGKLERAFGKTRGQAYLKGEYHFLDSLPIRDVTYDGGVPPCDLLCQMVED